MIYVADAGRRAVVVMQAAGAPRVLAEGQFAEPAAVALLADGSLVVVDAGASAILRLSADGQLGERMPPEQGMYSPRGISASADGRYVVADTGNNRLLLVSPDGAVREIGDLQQPTDAAFLPDGTLLVAETAASQVVVLQPDGKRVASWSMPWAHADVAPHVAALPGGGWVATAPNAHAVVRMAPNGRAPETWLDDPSWGKLAGIAAGPTGVVVIDGGGTATLAPLP